MPSLKNFKISKLTKTNKNKNNGSKNKTSEQQHFVSNLITFYSTIVLLLFTALLLFRKIKVYTQTCSTELLYKEKRMKLDSICEK